MIESIDRRWHFEVDKIHYRILILDSVHAIKLRHLPDTQDSITSSLTSRGTEKIKKIIIIIVSCLEIATDLFSSYKKMGNNVDSHSQFSV